mgnify:FL=1
MKSFIHSKNGLGCVIELDLASNTASLVYNEGNLVIKEVEVLGSDLNPYCNFEVVKHKGNYKLVSNRLLGGGGKGSKVQYEKEEEVSKIISNEESKVSVSLNQTAQKASLVLSKDSQIEEKAQCYASKILSGIQDLSKVRVRALEKINPLFLERPSTVAKLLLECLVKPETWSDSSLFRLRHRLATLSKRYLVYEIFSCFNTYESSISPSLASKLNQLAQDSLENAYEKDESGSIAELETIQSFLNTTEECEWWNDLKEVYKVLVLVSKNENPNFFKRSLEDIKVNYGMSEFKDLVSHIVIDSVYFLSKETKATVLRGMLSRGVYEDWKELYCVLSCLEYQFLTKALKPKHLNVSFESERVLRLKEVRRSGSYVPLESPNEFQVIEKLNQLVDFAEFDPESNSRISYKAMSILAVLKQDDLIQNLPNKPSKKFLKLLNFNSTQDFITNFKTQNTKFYKRQVKQLRTTLKNQKAALIKAKEGCGKTSFWSEYIDKYKSYYNLVWVVQAGSYSSIVQSFLKLTYKLEVPQTDLKEAVKYYLYKRENTLLVFENALNYQIISSWFPVNSHIIVTSSEDFPLESFELRPLTSDSALKYLVEQTDRIDETDSLKQLAQVTMRVPLLLSYSVNFLRIKKELSVSDFMDSLQAFQRKYKCKEPQTAFVAYTLNEVHSESQSALVTLKYFSHFNTASISRKFLEEFFSDTKSLKKDLKVLRKWKIVETHSEGLRSSLVKVLEDFPKDLDALSEFWSKRPQKSFRKKYIHHLEAFLKLKEVTELDIGTVEFISDYIDQEDFFLEIIQKFSFGNPRLHSLLVKLKQYNLALENLLELKELEFVDGAFLYLELGNTYKLLGDNQSALEHFKTAEEVAQQEALASVYNSIALLKFEQKNYKEAKSYFRKTSNLLENFADADSEFKSQLASAYLSLGLAYEALHDWEPTERFFERCKNIREEVFQNPSIPLADIYNHLGRYHKTMGNFRHSEKFYLKSKKTRELLVHKTHLDLASDFESLGCLYMNQRKFNQAEKMLLKCLKIREQNSEPLLTANAYLNLGTLCCKLSDPEKACEYYLKCEAIRQELLGPEHHLTARVWHSKALAYITMKRYEESLSLLKTCLKVCKSGLGRNDPEVASIYNSMATAYKFLEDYEQFEECYSKCEMILRFNRKKGLI